MPSDYDLVILGGSLEGRIAALTAVGYGARVALIEPPGLFEQRQQKHYLLQALQQLGEGDARQGVVRQLQTTNEGTGQARWDWQAILAWSAIAAQTQNPTLSADYLNVCGVDVVLEMPERLSRQLVVTTATRRLTARGVLAAFGTVPLPIASLLEPVESKPAKLEPAKLEPAELEPATAASKTDAEAETDAETDEEARLSPFMTGIDPLLSAPELPKEITIIGDSAEAVMWAEALCLMGSKVRLVSDRFLRFEDADVRRLVRSQLIAMGVSIIPFSNSQDPQNTQNAADSAITKHALLLGQGQPALILPGFVKSPTQDQVYTDHQGHGKIYLHSNPRLQTSHPRIFACGSLIAGFSVHRAIAIAEAQTAVRNALFLPTRRMRYRAIPEGYNRFARVGQTPRFARQSLTIATDGYGHHNPDNLNNNLNNQDSWDGWSVWTASSPNSTDLTRTDPFPAYCKLICYEGKLQSIHLLGEGAGELIVPLAAMIGKPVSAIARVISEFAADELVDLVAVAAKKAARSRWQPGQWRRDWAENWFNWRRSQS